MKTHRPRRDQSGAALIMALFVAILSLGIALSGTITLQANKARTETHFMMKGQATQVAYSGLTETLNWLRLQEKQPVTEFAPVSDPTANPPVEETLDPDIGLVREFQIRGDLWGRYEVWKPWETDPDASRLALRRNLQAVDISNRSTRAINTSAWLVKSIGFVYRRVDPDVSFDTTPNTVLGATTLETEFSRAYLVLPGQAAINGRMGGPVNIHDYARVLGGSEAAGIYFLSQNGSPLIKGTLTGAPDLAPTTNYDDSPETIFGVTEDTLRTMADFYITDANDFPVPVPPLSIVFVDESVNVLQFSDKRPLIGSGIVYAKGNLQIKARSDSDFAGLVYAFGHMGMEGPSRIRGSVVIKKGLNMGAQGPGLAIVEYDADALAALASKFDNYRMSSAIRNTQSIR